MGIIYYCFVPFLAQQSPRHYLNQISDTKSYLFLNIPDTITSSPGFKVSTNELSRTPHNALGIVPGFNVFKIF